MVGRAYGELESHVCERPTRLLAKGGPTAGVILVHGLWHAPSHFALVADGLRARGVQVAVPELHRGSLVADTAAVQIVVDAMPVPPLVLGHSYGGSVITGLSGVAHLIYLAAYVPAAGESISFGSTTTMASAIKHRGGGATACIDPARAVDAFYGDCPADLAASAVALLRPQNKACVHGVPERFAWNDTPSTYVVCSLDRAMDPALQLLMARHCGAVRTWPTSHSPFLSRPDLVIELLIELLSVSEHPGDQGGQPS